MKIVIDGAGEVGSHLAKMLSQEANDISVIDSDPARLERINSEADVITFQGSPSSIKVMKEAQVQKADLFISVVPNVPQDVNIVSALIAKNLGAKKVTARIDDEEFLAPENKLLFKQMGIELMFHPEKLAADEIVDVLKHSQATDAMDLGHGKLQIEVFKVGEDSPLMDLKLAEFAAVAATSGFQFRVIAVSRNGLTLMPKPETKFMYNDKVFIISTREGMAPLMKYLGKNTLEINSAMIIGGSQIAELAAAQLARKLESVKIIVKDMNRAMELSEKLVDNVVVINGDDKNTDLLMEEGIKDMDAFVALTENDEANILSCVVAKKFGVERAIAEVENNEYVRLAEEMGVDTVINKKLITAGRLFKYTLSGKARLVKYMSGTDAEVLEYNVAPGSAITKAPLKDLGFPQNAIIGGVIRGAESLIAVGDTVIEPYDRVAVFALPTAVKEVDKFFK
jgi:trk system potassium uptake protein TrkA